MSVRQRPRIVLGRVCGVIAVVLCLLWLAGPVFLNAAGVTGANHSGVLLTDGRVEATFSQIADVQLMIETGHSGRERLDIDGGAYKPTRPLLDGWGTPKRSAVRWFPITGGWSLLPGISNWSDVRTTVRVPYWCFATPFAAAAVVAERRHRAWLAQERLGKCATCGYDRTGLAAAALCPECGKA